MRYFVSAAVLLLLVPAASAQPRHADLDGLVREALEAWQVPGAAVVVVHQDQVVYLNGHGLRDREAGQPVTADTLFPIASCTKAFTTAAMAVLVEEGKIGWDDPVRKHLPAFRLSDPLADANVTLRDLLTHRTGLAGHDLLWYRAPWSQEEMIRRIGLVKPSVSFRSGFQYQSILYTAAGRASAAAAAGQSWEELVRKKLLEPLEMSATCFTSRQARRSADRARPYRKLDGQVKATADYDMDEPNPAGSIHTTARDLAKWLQLQAGLGRYRGRQLVRADCLAETHTPQVPLRMDDFARDVHPFTVQMSYALGWIVQDYRGLRLLNHTGVIDGFRTHILLLPDQRLGVAVLANLHGTRMNLALGLMLIDQFLGLPYHDWNARYRKLVEQEESAIEERIRRELGQRKAGTRPSRPLPDYTGQYEDPAYGTCTVSLEEGGLVWQWSTFRCPLEHFHYDTFLAREVLPAGNDFLGRPQPVFELDTNGDVAAVHVIGVRFRKK
jgi:CubicO group peptidase (beta-lactamase class C family)